MVGNNMMCKYTIVMGTGRFCGHPLHEHQEPCHMSDCVHYKPLMGKIEGGK